MKRSRTARQFVRHTDPLAAPRLITDGIEVTDDGVWVWLLIPPGATYLLEEDDLARLTWESAASLGALLPAGADYHLKVLWSRPSDHAYRASWDVIRGVRAPGAAEFIGLGAHRIRRNADDGHYRHRVVLLGVRWPDTASSPTGSATDSVTTQGTRRLVRGLRSAASAHRDAHARLAAVREAIDRWSRQMAWGPLAAEQAPTGLVAWALAREMRRVDLAAPEENILAGPALANLLHGEIDPRPSRHVVVTDLKTGTHRYVSILCPATTGFPPTELSLPGGEWLEILAELPGVEASVRGVCHGQQGSIDLLDAGRRLTRSQAREAATHGTQVPLEIVEADDVLTLRRREVQRRQDLLATNHARWVVDAGSVAELQDKIGALQQRYTGLVTLDVVPHVQDLLWAELLPGDRVRVPEFGQDQPLRTLTGSGFAGGSALGDTTGPYVGANLGSTPGPVRIHLVSRARADVTQPTTVAFTGRSRAGKSTAVNLACLGALAEGAWSLVVDPKGDLGGVVTVAREVLRVPVQVVDVTHASASGIMDPLRFSPTADTARSLALDALLSPLSIEDRRHEVLLEAAVDAVLAMPRQAWSAPTVINDLLSTPTTTPGWDTARELGRTLLLRAKQPHLRPVLGPLADAARPLQTGRGLVYLSLAGLELPHHNPSPDRWTVAERCAMTTFRVALAYALGQSRTVRELKKVVAFTELHLISAYPEGRAAIEWLARTGAALQTYVLLDTQAAADLATITGLVEQVVMSFAFRADTVAEQDAQAKLLGVPEPGPRLRQAQASLGTGQCLVRDRRSRRGVLEWDLLDRWIADALSTDAGDDRADIAAYPTDEPDDRWAAPPDDGTDPDRRDPTTAQRDPDPDHPQDHARDHDGRGDLDGPAGRRVTPTTEREPP